MLNKSETKYVWAVEWNNPFAQPDKGIVLSDVTLLHGVTEEAFENFVAEEGFAAVEGILTRAVRFGHQYLLKYTKDAGSDPLDSIQREASEQGSNRRRRFFAMRSNLVVIIFTMLSWSAFAQNGIDRPGGDYSNFSAPTAYSCRITCAGESNCQAYTWHKPEVQGGIGHCWLKSSVPAAVKDACCVSDTRGFIRENTVKAEPRIDRPGLDFKNFNTDQWQKCEAACTETKACKSWTYVLAGTTQGPSGHCWLKSGVGRPVFNPNMASGVKFTELDQPKSY